MSLIEIIAISIGLAMDSCAVSICTGISMKKFKINKALQISFWFGLFQGLMPVLGYLLGNTFVSFIGKIDHLIAFIILLLIGLNMIKENRESIDGDNLSFKNIILLGIATSIDALVIGITFSFLDANIEIAVLCIGIITFILSFIGVKLGNFFAKRFLKNPKYERFVSSLGGIILILMGIKSLLEYLGIF